jgi:hypothetical protein
MAVIKIALRLLVKRRDLPSTNLVLLLQRLGSRLVERRTIEGRNIVHRMQVTLNQSFQKVGIEYGIQYRTSTAIAIATHIILNTIFNTNFLKGLIQSHLHPVNNVPTFDCSSFDEATAQSL